MVEWALYYAANGRPVFPCHTPTADGGCSCNKGGPCKKGSPGKHPRTQHGCKGATTNPARIREWWRKWPEANIGLPTGGRIVLDGDSLKALAAIRRLKLPRCPTDATGRGEHYYLTDPTGKARSTPTDKALPGLPDVHVKAGAGSYVMAPPSLHYSGKRYRWEVPPWEVAPPPAPAHLLELLTAPAADPDRGGDPPADDGPIPYHTRNSTLAVLAWRLHQDGEPRGSILAQLVNANRRCTTADGKAPLPLSEDDLQVIVDGMLTRHPAGTTGPVVRVDRRLLRAGLTDGALALLVTRQALVQRTGAAPRLAALAEALGVTSRSVRNWQAELAAAGVDYERPRRRFVTAPVELLTDPQVTAAAKVTALHLLACLNDGDGTVGTGALTARRGLCEAIIRRHLHTLADRGHLLVTRSPFNPELGRRERCNRYQFAALVALAPVAAHGLTAQKRKQSTGSVVVARQKRKQSTGESRPSSDAPLPAVSLKRIHAQSEEPFSAEAADPRPAIVETQAPLPELASAPAADPPPARPDPECTTAAPIGDGNDLQAAQAQALADELAAREGLTPEKAARLAVVLQTLLVRYGLAQVQAIYACGPGRHRRGVA